MSANLQKVRELFLHAVGKLPPEQWEAFIAQASQGNIELRDQVRHYLCVHREAGSFLESPVFSVIDPQDEPTLETPGAMIGAYKLLEQIGEGGFGVVFMAEQQQPIRRKVALKILKPGMDTRQIVARFEAERQALALMDHPNIAKVFDGGMASVEPSGRRELPDEPRRDEPRRADASTLAVGRPYFVMELVKGVPITEFCDKNHLTARQRLELFIPVCQAVQHAHQKGIIHRDLKPSNILVVMHDPPASPLAKGGPRGVPKVIDFGIAKAIGEPGSTPQLTEKTLFTGFAQMIGTPLYMSPEQAGQSGLDVDTRSDIYSLGVLLYELLTGTTPFDKERFKEAAYDEIRRIIREEDPPRPSTRFSTLKNAPCGTVNDNANPRSAHRIPQLHELDWIVMKALEKDRSRRYETAGAFAEDVQRYLRDEPVLACPPSPWYRLRKLVRRNKGVALAMTGAALVLMLLVAGLMVHNVRIAERESVAKAQQKRAEHHFQQALDAIDLFLVRISRDVEMQPQARRRILSDAQRFFEKFLEDDDATDPAARLHRAQAHWRLARVQVHLGDFAAAEKHHQRGLTLCEELVAEYPNDVTYLLQVAAHCNAFAALYAYHAHDHQPAERLYREALKAIDKAVALDPSARNRFVRATTRHKLAYRLWKDDRVPEADAIYFQALAELKTMVQAEPRSLSYRKELQDCLVSHSILLRQADRLAEAEQASRQALAVLDELQTTLNPTHDYREQVARSLLHLSAVLWRQRRHDEAEKAIARCVNLWEATLADYPTEHGHMEWALAAHGYGTWLVLLDRPREAEHYLRLAAREVAKLVAELKHSKPLWSTQAGTTQTSFGQFLHDRGRADEAAVAFAAALGAYRDGQQRFPEDTELLGRFAWFLTTCPDPKFRDVEQASALAQKAVDLGPARVQGWLSLGLARHRTGDHTGAIAALEKAATLRSGDDNVGGFILAMAHWQLGNHETAREQWRRTVAWMEQKMPDHAELRRFRKEAAELLKIADEPMAK